MKYILKNGKNVVIRKPNAEDAESIINVMSIADTETLFLARNPGEFSISVKREREIITNILNDNDKAIKMYTDFGFEITGTISKALHYQDGTYADEYIMIKNI